MKINVTCEVQQLLENKLGHQPLDSNIKRGTLLDISHAACTSTVEVL